MSHPGAWPRLATIRQNVPPAERIADAREATRDAWERSGVQIKAGARVAIATGSRGLDRIDQVIKATVEWVKSKRGWPVIVPAMGSHGGASAEGQASVLADYGVTAEKVDAPIEANVEAVSIGHIAEGDEVLFSRAALAVDAILVINRIKPHTDFGGPLGSGISKMLVVGLGKPDGAASFHRAAARLGHERVLRSMTALIRGRTPFVAGLALIEGRDHGLCRIEVVPTSALETEEPRLLAEAKALMPQLPYTDIDLLIVDEMGKDISGCGMDPNIIGRSVFGYSLAGDRPRAQPAHIERIFVRDLTPASHGNAMGIGLADLTTTRLVKAIDHAACAANAYASLSLQGVKVPLAFDRDDEAIAFALGTLGKPIEAAKVLRIRDTLHLDACEASEALLRDHAAAPIDVVGSPAELNFAADGQLHPLRLDSLA